MNHVLICDDHALVREALAGTVALAWPGARVDLAGDFPTAWAKAAQAPDLILCDLVMPGAAPLQAIDGLIAVAPQVPLLVVTGTEDDGLLLDLLQRGVAGFAPKSASGAIIEAAMRLILAGGRYMPPRLADIATSRLQALQRDAPSPGTIRLTDRQRDVLQLIAQGQSNKEIARALDLSPSTVKTHIAQVLLCLGAANRTEAAIKARRLALV